MRNRSKANKRRFIWVAGVAAIFACSKTTSDNVVARGTVTPESGGTIATTDGRLTLAFPPGAVGASTEITVRATPRAEQAPGAIDGFSYTLSPSGLTFDAGVGVTMRLLTSDALATMLSQKTDGGADGGLPLVLPVLRDDDGGEELLQDASVVVTGDGGAVTLTGELRHFSQCSAWIDSITMYINPPELTMNVGEATTGVFHLNHGLVGTPTGDVLTPALAVSGYDVKSLNPQVLAAAKSASNSILGALLYGVDGDFRFQEGWDRPSLICVGAGSAVWQAEVTGTLVQIPATLTAVEENAYRRKMLGKPFKLAVTADAKCVGSGPPPDGGGDVGPDAGDTGDGGGGGGVPDGGGVADGGGVIYTESIGVIAWTDDGGLRIRESAWRISLDAGVTIVESGTSLDGGAKRDLGSLGGGTSLDPVVAISGAGTVYTAWSQDYCKVFVASWNGSTWSELGGSASDAGINAPTLSVARPQIAIDPTTGYPAIVWTDYAGGAQEVYAKKWNGSAWLELGGSATDGGVSGTTGQSQYVSIAAAPTGRFAVAWADNTPGHYSIYSKEWNGSSWAGLGASAFDGGLSGTTGTAVDPSVTYDPAGRPFVAWADNSTGNYEVYVRRWNGSAWDEMGASATGGGVSSSTSHSRKPSIAHLDGGFTTVAWQEALNGDTVVYVKRFDLGQGLWTELGGSASDAGVISASDGGVTLCPSLDLFPGGAPVTAALRGGDTVVEIKSFNNSSWVPIEIVSMELVGTNPTCGFGLRK